MGGIWNWFVFCVALGLVWDIVWVLGSGYCCAFSVLT